MRVLLFLFYIINGHLLFQVGTNPIGIYFANEVFIVLLILYSFFYVYESAKRKQLTSFEFLFFITPFVMAFHSSILAMYHYEQPIIYGLIESRRVFYVLAIFPLFRILKLSSISMQDAIVLYLYACLTICIIFLLFRLIGFVPDKLGLSYINKTDSLASWRMGAGQLYIPIALLFLSAYQAKLGLSKIFIVFSYSFLFIYLALIVQSRQLFFATIVCVSLLYIFDTRKNIVTKLSGLLFTVLLVIALFVFSNFVDEVINRTTIAEFRTMKSARSWSYYYAMRDLSVLGRGALSLLFDDGYKRIYHENFYLIDIGIIGSLYRFGLMYLGYVIVLVFGITKLFRNKLDKPFIFSIALLILITSVTSSAFEYYFYAYSIAFAIIFHFSRNSALKRR